jgi:2-polyprenyl-6-methoxyphenol hydroxylase-like FAD-dependent oxidoreductase
MNKTTVLISGASVAGPALAFWLERYGYDVTVIERAPVPRPGGYAVDFRGASLKVLDRMGLLAAVEAKATHMGDMIYVNKKGRKLATSPTGNISGELEVLRGDLVEILYDATRARVEYVFDDSITSLSQDATGIDVTFERGTPGGSTWSSARTACTPTSAGLPSATRRTSSTSSASTPRSPPSRTTSAWTTPGN